MDKNTKVDRLKILYNEGTELAEKDLHAEAAIKLKKAVSLAENLCGKNHPAILLYRDNLAVSLHKSGSYSQAASCNEDTLKRRRDLGSEVVTLGVMLENQRRLGRNYVRLGQRKKAMIQYREICEFMTKTLKGPPNRETESTWPKMRDDANDLVTALVEYLKSHEERSNADISHTVQLCKELLDSSSLSSDDGRHVVLYNLGCVLETCGRSAEAKGLFEQVVLQLRHRDGQTQPQEARNLKDILGKAAERLKHLGAEAPSITVSDETPAEHDDASTTMSTRVNRAFSRKGRTFEGSLDVGNVHIRPNSVPPAHRTEAPALHSGGTSQGRTLTTPTGDQKHTTRRRRKSDLSLRERKGGLLGADSGMNQAESFFTRLESTVHTFLDHGGSPKGGRVKIAVLDTGVSSKSKTKKAGEVGSEAEKKLNEAKQKMQSVLTSIATPKPRMQPSADGSSTHGPRDELLDHPNIDNDGHGTECFFLISRVCPYANITSYRVMRDRKDVLDVNRVNAALEHAITVQKVDIISMSFGLEEDNDKTNQLIKLAHEKDVLLFAATSNSGKGMKFPARSTSVIAVDAAKDDATPYTGNPARFPSKLERFTALGVDIESVMDSELQSGTSFATPVAAGTAGLLLHFAKQAPLYLEERILQRLKTQEGILQVFREELCLEKAGFHYIDITKLRLWCEDIRKEQHDWFDHRSSRYKAAMQIAEVFGASQKELTTSIEDKCDRLRRNQGSSHY